MSRDTKARLEAAGFRETNIRELLGLTDEQVEFIETRLALARLVKRLRGARHMSQATVAKLLDSDQANVSKAEHNDSSISIDWMVRAALALGANRKDIALAISS